VVFDTLQSFRLDGRAALERVIQQSRYGSLEQAVASLALFSHPATVAQTRGSNVFRIVRARMDASRGEIDEIPGVGRVMIDDNKGPTDALTWVHGISRNQYRDVQFNHIWPDSRDVGAYTNLANICVLPAFLSKLSDAHSQVRAVLQFRAFDLYSGWKPVLQPRPITPAGYDDLIWAETLPAIPDVEVAYRRAMKTKPKDRTTASARNLGWVFSEYKPDPTV
jgi:hypothetical protein